MRRVLGFLLCFSVLVSGVASFTSGAAAFELELPDEELDWIQVTTPNFAVFSNADRALTIANAVSLEQLWMVLARDVSGVPKVSPIPSKVFVFDLFNDSYPAYGPLSKKGKPKRSGGYFISSRAGYYFAVVERDYRYPNRMEIYHDFVHAVLEAHHPELPLCFEEGLVEYYSIFHIHEGRARVGYRINRHIARLRNGRLMPVRELLAVDRSSPESTEDDRTGMFSAQSWLLTHMLLTERPGGRAQIESYAGLLSDGVDRDAAFVEAFGSSYEELDAELKKYLRSKSFHYSVFPLSREIVASTEIREMSRAEALVQLGDLLANGLEDRSEFAEEHFSTALAIDSAMEPVIEDLGLGAATTSAGGTTCAD